MRRSHPGGRSALMAVLVRHDIELLAQNTFRLPARAEQFVELTDPADLETLRRQFPEGPTLVLGEGSNLVLAADVPGLTLAPRLRGRWLRREADAVVLRLMAGERWHDTVLWSIAEGVGGLENLALIWGHCGAAPIQNIGAYGVELQEVIDVVEVCDWRSGRLHRLPAQDCEFAYRDSRFKRWDGPFLVLAIELRLPLRWSPRLGYAGIGAMLETLYPGAAPTPARVAEAVIALRRQKLPDPALLPNVGSFFHNPLVSSGQAAELRLRYPELPAWPQPDGRVKLSAGWLIEQAGCKGWRHGDAGVSERHALVLVNHGVASGADVLALMRRVQSEVSVRFGVQLQPEPRVLPLPASATTLQ
jgi:UDP-N-acetylmuramate dehydrogenase